MKAYTEGPWEVRIWDGEDWPEKRISIGSGNDAVCINPRYKFNIEDFNLIAAAPDLLEALIDMVAIAQLDKWDQAVSGRQSFLWNAKVAIAKARGESVDQ